MQKVNVVCPHCHGVNSIPIKESYNKANCGHCKNSLLETKPINFNANSFDLHVANSDIPIIVDFWANWCAPCKMMAPAFEQTAKEFALKAQFAKIDTENEQQVAVRFNIRSIPTMIAFKGNREVDRVSGALNAQQISQWVKKFL